MKNKSFLKITFYSLITIFIFLLVYFLAPISSVIKRRFFPLVVILGFIFFILGVMLAFIAKKRRGKLKLFLTMTGISAMSFFAFSILHNLFYGLGITFENFKYLFEALHIASFIISIIIAPIAFIIGVIGSLILFRHKI